MTENEQSQIKKLEKEISTLKQLTTELISRFFSFKAVQDAINITLVQHTPEIKAEIAGYIESYLGKSPNPIMDEAIAREVQETLKYLRQENPLSPEERRERFCLVGRKGKPN